MKIIFSNISLTKNFLRIYTYSYTQHFHPISNQFFHFFFLNRNKSRKTNIDRPPPSPSFTYKKGGTGKEILRKRIKD